MGASGEELSSIMGGLVEDNRMEKKGGNRATKRAATKKMDDGVTIGELKEMMRVFVGEREWGKFHTPRNLAARGWRVQGVGAEGDGG
jgi:hypothetical protein